MNQERAALTIATMPARIASGQLWPRSNHAGQPGIIG